MVFLSVLALSRIKWFKLGLFGTNPGTQYYLVYIIVLKCLESKSIVICLKLRAKLLFKGFFKRFGTFLHKVVKTCFVLHATWHTTLFGIYYCVEMVKIEINSDMLNIRC